MAKKRAVKNKRVLDPKDSSSSLREPAKKADQAEPTSSSRSKQLQMAILLGALIGGPLGWLLKFGNTWKMGMFICGGIGLFLSMALFRDVLDDEKEKLTLPQWLLRVVIYRLLPIAVSFWPGAFFDKISRGSDWKLFLAVFLGALLGAVVGAVVAPLLNTASPKRLIRPFGLTLVMLFFFLWIFPVLWVGGVKKSVPGYPAFIQNLYRISCLFTHSSSVWKTAHYQVQFAGSQKWVEGFEPGFFDQSIFGYRTRFNRILGQSINRGRKGQKRQRKMAEYIRDRWKVLYPNDPAVVKVRYIRVTHRINESHCMANERWRKLPLSTYPESEWRFEATHDLTKPWKYIPKKKKKKKKKASPKKSNQKKVPKAVQKTATQKVKITTPKSAPLVPAVNVKGAAK